MSEIAANVQSVVRFEHSASIGCQLIPGEWVNPDHTGEFIDLRNSGAHIQVAPAISSNDRRYLSEGSMRQIGQPHPQEVTTTQTPQLPAA